MEGDDAVDFLRGFPVIWFLSDGWEDLFGEVACLQLGDEKYHVRLPGDACFALVPTPVKGAVELYEVTIEQEGREPFAISVSLPAKVVPAKANHLPSAAQFVPRASALRAETLTWFLDPPPSGVRSRSP